MTKLATRPGKRAAAPVAVPAAVPAPAKPLPSLDSDDRHSVPIKEAVRLTGISRSTFELMIKDGRLSDIKIGKLRGRLILIAELRALLAPTITRTTPVREAA
jgi:excisionase family DNA binding protein